MKWKTFQNGKVVYNFSRLTITNYPSKRNTIFFSNIASGIRRWCILAGW